MMRWLLALVMLATACAPAVKAAPDAALYRMMLPAVYRAPGQPTVTCGSVKYTLLGYEWRTVQLYGGTQRLEVTAQLRMENVGQRAQLVYLPVAQDAAGNLYEGYSPWRWSRSLWPGEGVEGQWAYRFGLQSQGVWLYPHFLSSGCSRVKLFPLPQEGE